MNTSGMFRLNLSDVQKAFVMALLAGFALPVFAAVQTPGFSVLTVNWHAVLVLGINGAMVGAASYLLKNFFSNSNGQVFGKVG
jgi:alpha-D-ribose 1-methylphosphonate 5-triphosphate synthase subunit PhnL